MSDKAGVDRWQTPSGSRGEAPGERMAAVVVRDGGRRGQWNELVLAEVERPRPMAGQVLVQVEACSVNRADLLQRRGLYPPPPGESSLLGLDFAGYIVAKGAEVEKWCVGDRVFGIVAGGGYGRYVAVWADHLVPIPEELSFVEAAAVAEVFFTAYLNLWGEGRLSPGETLLVHGCGSGVGSAVVQLARATGATVITTLGDRTRSGRCRQLGAHHVICYRDAHWPQQVLSATGDAGVDLIVDWIGAPYLADHVNLLKTGGRLVIIGLMGGRKVELDLAPVLTKRLRIIGSVLRSRSREEKAELTRRFRRDVLPLLANREVKAVVDRIFSIRDAEEAHRTLRDEPHFGKVVLSWSPVER